MKKFLVVILLICLFMFSGCTSSKHSLDKEIETEMESVQKVIDKNVEDTFKTFG